MPGWAQQGRAEVVRADLRLVALGAPAAGVVRPGLDGDDVRLLLVGVAHAPRLGGADDARLERYLRVLLDGLRGDPA